MRLVWLLLPRLSAADVLINEVHYDAPSGEDEARGEWIELCNPTDHDVDLSGWQVQSAGKRWSTSWTFSDPVTLPAGGHLAFGPGVGASDTFRPNLQNGGDATDGIRLLDARGDVVDTLLYDAPNTNALPDDQGRLDGPFAPDVSAGQTLGRRRDCIERTDDGDDFVAFSVEDATPGAPNPSPPTCMPADAVAVVINELMANPPGADTGGEWVELVNPSVEDADISGWQLFGGTTAGGVLSPPLPVDTILPAGGHQVIWPLGVLGNASRSADGVILVDCDGIPADTVVYGEPSASVEGWTDDQGRVPSLAPLPAEGQSIGRLPDGLDTDEMSADFVLLPFASPGEANDTERTCPGQHQVKINELLPDPDSDATAEDAGREWVELYNAGDVPVSLEGWALEWGTQTFSGQAVLPSALVIPAGGFLLLGGEHVPDVDATVGFAMGSAARSPDAVRLLHCGPGVADAVIYGPPDADNIDEWRDASGQIATSWAPDPDPGHALARRFDGEDSDEDAVDFVITAAPSPGASNPVHRCEAGLWTIKINEIFPDPEGSDGGQEWIELFNSGDVPVALDGWRIQAGSSSWLDRAVLPSGTTISPGEHLLFADADLEGVLGLGNAATGLDGVRLLDCPGAVEDTLLYGHLDVDIDAIEDTWRDDAGEQRFAVAVSSPGVSLGRHVDGLDTEDCRSDFVEMPPTPGEPNGAMARGGAPVPPRGCDTVPGSVWWGWVWGLLVIVWRRGRAGR